MNPPKILLSASEIGTVLQDPLDLFYSGIKAAETRRTMNGNLKRFLVEACADILQGDYKQRARGRNGVLVGD